MLNRDKFGNILVKYVGGQIVIREADGSFLAADGSTIPLQKGIVIKDGSIKSNLPFEAFAELVASAYKHPELMEFLNKNGINLKKALIG